MQTKDDRAEKVRSLSKWMMVGSSVFGFGSLFLGAVLGPLALILFAICLVLFIVGAVRYVRHGHADVEDRKLEVVKTVLENLLPELHPKRPVAITVDFRGHSKIAPTKKESVRRGQNSFAFEHAWLEMRFVLRDGTAVAIRVTTHEKRKTKAKRKYIKVKGRAYETADIQYRFGDQDQAPTQPFRTQTQAQGTVIQLQRNGRKGVARLTGPKGTFQRGRYQTTDTTRGIDGQWLTRALVQTFRPLKQAS